MFEFRINPTPTHLIIQVARDTVRDAAVFETELTRHANVGSTLTQLQAATASTAETLQNRASDLSGTGLTKAAEKLIGDSIKPAFDLSVEVAHRERRNLETEWNRLHTPKFAKDSEQAVRAEQRSWARSLKLPASIAAAQRDPALAAAIVEGGVALSGWPADQFDRIQHDMAIGQLATIMADQHDYLTPATPDDPVGGQPDFEAARAVAAERFKNLEAERELIGRIPTLLASVVTAVAVMMEETRQAAFERLTA